MPRHIVNICFAQGELEPFITYACQTTNKVMVVVPCAVGFEIWPWAKWSQKYRLGARFALRETIEDQLGSLGAIIGELSDDYERVGFFARLRRRFRMHARRIEVVVKCLNYGGLAFGDPKNTTAGMVLDALSTRRCAIRML